MLFREMRAFVLSVEIMVKGKVLIGAFAQFRKATVSFVMSVRPSFRMEHQSSHWTELL